MGALRDEVERVTLADPRNTENTKPLEEVTPISIHPDYPDHHVMIGTELTDELRNALNAGATYQRLVNKMFKEQMGKTMEVYIDDMLVKSLQAADHVAHLEEAFGVLRKHRMMLNPSKCIFGVSSGKFLGFLVTKRGIEANPDQIRALVAMSSSRNIREVQQLTSRVAALNRFVSKSADKCLPFFRILRKNQAFQWDEESEVAFQQLKEYLGSLPLLFVPNTGEELLIYLFVSPIAIEKLAYALIIAARKLCHYFQAHPIAVLTDQPLKQILQRPDTLGRLLKWSIELNEFHVVYKPRMAIKAQALADFVVESKRDVAHEPDLVPPEVGTPAEQNSDNLDRWLLFVDGSSNQHGCGARLVLQTPTCEQMEHALRIGFKATNNEAEYEALLAGLRMATGLGVDSLDAFSDSQLVVNQVQVEYFAKDSRMIAYLDEVKIMMGKIKNFKIRQIPREENKQADALANLASSFDFISDRSIPMEFLAGPSIQSDFVVFNAEEGSTWMDDIFAYLQYGTLPQDRLQARRIQYRSARFCILSGVLYKRSFLGPLLRCLRPEEGEYVIKKIHEGICRNHSGTRSLAKKAIRQGYYCLVWNETQSPMTNVRDSPPLVTSPIQKWCLSLDLGPSPNGV
ncbi:uncharacterized protein LOC130787093 [Actinidia eriantha]|uniref:uncharacterized protein LOC130787093 n=1 Tax=Actinidia eriantha TaxID=165200 RepID=UPI002584B629|nr:uncharacterized protein LOC130787093 [Actinidia eriantha]